MADNGWSEYQKLVLAELKRLDANVLELRDEVSELRVSVEVLRQKAVTWGALGGFIVWLTTVAGASLLK
jgi:hypothetical protein|tara:strand:- start:89 stop:295 length:207 start_codon:yes stop_codon:yes gene_type:complete